MIDVYPGPDGHVRVAKVRVVIVTWNSLKNDVDLRDFVVEQSLYYEKISEIPTRNIFRSSSSY